MVKIYTFIAVASLVASATAHQPSDPHYEREIQDYDQEAREYGEYSDVLQRNPEPFGIGGAMAGASAGTGLFGGLLSAIGNVVPGKAGEGLRGAGQVITGAGKGLTGRSEIPDDVHEYVARNIDEEDIQYLREFYDKYAGLLEREPEPLGIGGAMAGASAGTGPIGGLLSAIGNVVPGKAGEGLRGAGQVITGVGKGLTGRSEIPDGEYAARDSDYLTERGLGWENDIDGLD